eukprot:sb/3477245/
MQSCSDHNASLIRIVENCLAVILVPEFVTSKSSRPYRNVAVISAKTLYSEKHNESRERERERGRERRNITREIDVCLSVLQEPTEISKQPIRTRYLGHVTGYQPIRDQY